MRLVPIHSRSRPPFGDCFARTKAVRSEEATRRDEANKKRRYLPFLPHFRPVTINRGVTFFTRRHERKCRDGNMGWGWPSPTVGAWVSRMVREKYASLRLPRYSGGPSQLDPEYARFAAAAVRRIPGSWILFESKIIRARPAAFLTALVDERGRPYLM